MSKCVVCLKSDVEPQWDITCRACGDSWKEFMTSDGRERTLEHEIVDFSIEWAASRAREVLEEDWFAELNSAVNEAYTCGGAGPGEGCQACNVWHAMSAKKGTP